MKFSLVVPSYNQIRYLPVCLDSLLAQTGIDLEILVYDGGSTDGSADLIVRRYAPYLAHWQSQPDGGQAAALQAGFARATGDILGWVNSDDLLLPGALAAVETCFRSRSQLLWVYGDAAWIDENGNLIRLKREIDFYWPLFAYGYCYLPQPSTFFRRSAYEQAGGLDSSLRCCMDYDLWHKLSRLGRPGHLKQLLSGLRDHPQTKTRNLGADFSREHQLLAQRYHPQTIWPLPLRRLACRFGRSILRIIEGSYASPRPGEIHLLHSAAVASGAKA